MLFEEYRSQDRVIRWIQSILSKLWQPDEFCFSGGARDLSRRSQDLCWLIRDPSLVPTTRNTLTVSYSTVLFFQVSKKIGWHEILPSTCRQYSAATTQWTKYFSIKVNSSFPKLLDLVVEYVSFLFSIVISRPFFPLSKHLHFESHVIRWNHSLHTTPSSWQSSRDAGFLGYFSFWHTVTLSSAIFPLIRGGFNNAHI